MFKTEAYVSEKIWGYEKWLISTHKACMSFANDKNLSVVIGDEYPLIVKLIQANETLSVQVHPDDEYAKINENSKGKTECWYILDACVGSSLICGLNNNYSKLELETAIKKNSLSDCLRYVPVSKGDFVFIPAGTVHAIQGGIRILEIQESSDITYRLYDWGRDRELHFDKGLQVIKHNSPEVIVGFNGPFSCEYFSLNTLTVDKGEVKIINSGNDIEIKSSALNSEWLSFFILEGAGELVSSTGERVKVVAEDTVMFHVSEVITAKNTTDKKLKLMKIF